MEREQIQKIIKEKGFTQKQIAVMAGIKPKKWAAQIFCDMVAGRRKGFKWQAKINELLGIDVFDDDGHKN
jgi:transcriptional regulator with XRE-family HTH domain